MGDLKELPTSSAAHLGGAPNNINNPEYISVRQEEHHLVGGSETGDINIIPKGVVQKMRAF